MLLSIRLLLAHPNPEDGLVPEITDLYRRNYKEFKRTAEEHTKIHASQSDKSQLESMEEKRVGEKRRLR